MRETSFLRLIELPGYAGECDQIQEMAQIEK